MTDISPAYRPALIPWLVEAAQGIRVMPEDANDALSTWVVEVNNGLGGHNGAGSAIAHCRTELEAELVAAALWALFERSGGGAAIPETEEIEAAFYAGWKRGQLHDTGYVDVAAFEEWVKGR